MSETITFNVDGTVDYALQGEERSHSQKANWVFCADCYKDDYGKQSTINLDIELSLGTWQVKDRFVLFAVDKNTLCYDVIEESICLHRQK
ncbi:hypothetical protein [Deinococcus hopiensis]|uniref:hypothetical protein n=1 Tax=Deinococcus hopiensis TaxID=309885 RepID=UPI00111BF8F9|nr:hypothetical protein [Deinococcus hopiensis]